VILWVYVESFSGRDGEASEVCQKLVMVRDVWPGGECRLGLGKNSCGVQHQARQQRKI
jgi:hypothetical protein